MDNILQSCLLCPYQHRIFYANVHLSAVARYFVIRHNCEDDIWGYCRDIRELSLPLSPGLWLVNKQGSRLLIGHHIRPRPRCQRESSLAPQETVWGHNHERNATNHLEIAGTWDCEPQYARAHHQGEVLLCQRGYGLDTLIIKVKERKRNIRYLNIADITTVKWAPISIR